MNIQVNGESKELSDGATVRDLLDRLELDAAHCAVEVNKQLVRRASHGEHTLQPNDAVEIVTLVGGG